MENRLSIILLELAGVSTVKALLWIAVLDTSWTQMVKESPGRQLFSMCLQLFPVFALTIQAIISCKLLQVSTTSMFGHHTIQTTFSMIGQPSLLVGKILWRTSLCFRAARYQGILPTTLEHRSTESYFIEWLYHRLVLKLHGLLLRNGYPWYIQLTHCAIIRIQFS